VHSLQEVDAGRPSMHACGCSFHLPIGPAKWCILPWLRLVLAAQLYRRYATEQGCCQRALKQEHCVPASLEVSASTTQATVRPLILTTRLLRVDLCCCLPALQWRTPRRLRWTSCASTPATRPCRSALLLGCWQNQNPKSLPELLPDPSHHANASGQVVLCI